MVECRRVYEDRPSRFQGTLNRKLHHNKQLLGERSLPLVLRCSHFDPLTAFGQQGAEPCLKVYVVSER